MNAFFVLDYSLLDGRRWNRYFWRRYEDWGFKPGWIDGKARSQSHCVSLRRPELKWIRLDALTTRLPLPHRERCDFCRHGRTQSRVIGQPTTVATARLWWKCWDTKAWMCADRPNNKTWEGDFSSWTYTSGRRGKKERWSRWGHWTFASWLGCVWSSDGWVKNYCPSISWR